MRTMTTYSPTPKGAPSYNAITPIETESGFGVSPNFGSLTQCTTGFPPGLVLDLYENPFPPEKPKENPAKQHGSQGIDQ